MTLDTIEKTVELLVAKGFAATLEYPGTIHIVLERSGKNQKQLLVFGCANETLGADTYYIWQNYEEADPDDVIETDLPSDCADPAKVADTIVRAIEAQ